MEELAYQRKKAKEEYPKLWDRMISEWKSSQKDRFWLTYSANYLLHTAGVKWAIDPYSLFTRVGGGEQPAFSDDLNTLQLVVLTHSHSDHLDLNLIAAIQDLPIYWVIPELLLAKVNAAIDLPSERIIVPQPGNTLRIDNLMLTPFDGLHIHGEHGVPAMGYLAEFSHKRWLFPGDTRDYDFSKLPDFGEMDGIVGHLWLGKAEALEQWPSKLDDFCQFFSQFSTKQLVITHLREYGRETNELWDLHHFQLVRTHILAIKPEIKISAVLMGESIDL
ncbi:MAG: MBL fold metallo-hydrolase [Anaerolineaceae bacterium]|nr:MBL fold metallo-hydrolase [Anaerolineaceae bacterium]